MKNLILIFLIVASITSCGRAQVDSIKNDWGSVQYFYDCGPLPPKYHHEYVITINKDNSAGMVYSFGYDKSVPSLLYDFKISAEDLKNLNDAVIASSMLDKDIPPMPENQHPIGGSMRKVRIVFVDTNSNFDRPPRVKESPYFPVAEYKENLENLYKVIVSLVPKNVWDDIENKKEK